MICDALYAQAFAFKNTKLWKRLTPWERFAVQLSEDEIAYVSVWGYTAQDQGIDVKFGKKEVENSVQLMSMTRHRDSYLRRGDLLWYESSHMMILRDEKEIEEEELKSIRNYAKRNKISLKGKHSYPIFMSQEKFKLPTEMPEDEQEKFCRILEAVLEVNRRVGIQTKAELGFRVVQFQPDAEAVMEEQEIPLLISTSEGGFRWSKTLLPMICRKHYEAVPFENEELAKRLREAEKKGNSYFILQHLPIDELEWCDECTPLCLISLYDEKNTVMISSPFEEDTETYKFDTAEMLTELGEDMLSEGNLPQTLCVSEEREEILLKNFAAACGFEMKILEKDIPKMEDAVTQAMNEIISQLAEYDEEEDDCDCGCDHDHEHHHDHDHHHHDGEKCDCGCEEEHEALTPEEFMVMMKMLETLPDEALQSMPHDLRMVLREMDKEGQLPKNVSTRIKKLFK